MTWKWYWRPMWGRNDNMTMRIKPSINLQAFTQEVDSGSLGMPGMVIHRFDQPGDYQIRIYQGDRLDRTVRLKVNKGFTARQLNIDLATEQQMNKTRIGEGCPCKEEDDDHKHHPPRELELASQGHIVFYVSHGLGGHWVSVRMSAEKPVNSFDSRELGNGDIFVANLIRPGTYSLTNVLSNVKGNIVVSYPQVGKTRYTPPEPLTIDSIQTFAQEPIKLQPGQGQIYRIKDKSRIKIQLVKPDDGPSEKPRHIRWEKARSKPTTTQKS